MAYQSLISLCYISCLGIPFSVFRLKLRVRKNGLPIPHFALLHFMLRNPFFRFPFSRLRFPFKTSCVEKWLTNPSFSDIACLGIPFSRLRFRSFAFYFFSFIIEFGFGVSPFLILLIERSVRALTPYM
jgi:hypothetical protein